MDGSLIRSALAILFIFVSSASNVVGQSGCFKYQRKWVRFERAAFIECTLDGNSHFWWKGKNCHNPSDFERFGIGNNGCMDSNTCLVDYLEFNRENSTFICCTENGPTDMGDARTMDCYQIAVCPTGVKMTVPPVVQTGKTATAYIEVVTKPIPPRDLDLIDIQVVTGDQATSLNHTQSLVTLPEGTDNALKVFYTFEFEVPLEMVSDSSTTLTFVQHVANLPTDNSICLSPSVVSVSRVPVLAVDPGPMVTTGSTTPTTNPTVATSESNTEAPDCLQPGITIGVSLATFLVGLICGLIPLIFCLVRQKEGKDMSQRRLPDIPNPQMQFQFRAPPNSIPELHHAASYSSSNDTQTTTPTPTDNQRLLAGQTPNNFPPVDHHPLNPQPYATTNEMKVLRLESMGQAYPPPVKNPLDFMYNTNFSGTTPTVHTIISTEFAGQHLQAPSPEQDSILRDSHYAREGDKMELGNPVEVAVV